MAELRLKLWYSIPSLQWFHANLPFDLVFFPWLVVWRVDALEKAIVLGFLTSDEMNLPLVTRGCCSIREADTVHAPEA